MPEWRTPDPVALHASAQPNKIACIDLSSGRQWDYRSLDRAIARAVTHLAVDLGIEPGQRIATIARNSADLLILQQAVMRIGAIFVPVNWRLSRSEQADILDDCAPVLLITDEDPATMTLPRNCRPRGSADVCKAIESAREASALPGPPADAPIVILYTSGTSGRPKGVMITGRNIFSTSVNFGVLG